MHEHKPIYLTDAQCAIVRQCSEALMKGKQNIDTYGNGAVKDKYEWQETGTKIGTFAVQEFRPTGQIIVCAACLQSLPLVLRELADMYEELAKQLNLPEEGTKSIFLP